MENIFDYLFGESGTAVEFFGGQWWLLGLFFLLVFAVLMFSAGVDGRAIAMMIMTGLVVMISENIFTLLSSANIYQTLIFFMLMFAGWLYYKWTQT